MRDTSVLLLFAAAAIFAQSDATVAGLDAFHRGDYAVAERSFKTALAKAEDPRARAFLAVTLAATGRCGQAEPDLDKALRAQDSTTRKLAGLALAQCCIAASRFDQAGEVLSKLRAEYPSDADVLYQSARLHMRAWNDTIFQLYQKNPSSFRVNQISGEILETQGQFAEAAAEYRKAIDKNPKALNLHFRLGRAILMSSHSPENVDAAMKEFIAELGLNPGDAIAHYQVGQVFLAQQQPGEAAAAFQRALDLKSDFPEALVALGRVRIDEKKNDEAIALLERAVKLTPANEAAHYSLMMAYRNMGKMVEARREKAELDKLQKAPEGEFSEFLKKIGEKPPQK